MHETPSIDSKSINKEHSNSVGFGKSSRKTNVYKLWKFISVPRYYKTLLQFHGICNYPLEQLDCRTIDLI